MFLACAVMSVTDTCCSMSTIMHRDVSVAVILILGKKVFPLLLFFFQFFSIGVHVNLFFLMLF